VSQKRNIESIVQTFVISLRINPFINPLKPATGTETETEAEQSSHVLPRRNPTQLEGKKPERPKVKSKVPPTLSVPLSWHPSTLLFPGM
jgi:hypothetical protein